MGGLRGNQAQVAWAKQTAYNTPNTTYVDLSPFSGGNIQPAREIDNLSETDAQRARGVSFVRQASVEGTPEVYVRDSNIHHLLQGALGGLATSGAGPDYTHTLTPAASIPYWTFYKEIAGTLFEQYDDCKISELTISADTGGPLTASAALLGRKATRLTSQPAAIGSLTLANDQVYNMNDATVELAGSATSLVSSFECVISNNVAAQQTDDFQPYDVVEGLFEVSLSFTLVFESLAEYNRFHYGGTAGTVQNQTLGTTDFDFLFSHGANNSLQFTFPSCAYEAFDVEPDPGGDPIEVDVRATAQRNASPLLTAVVKNQKAT